MATKLNEVQLESSILTDFAYYHLNSFNGKLNGSRKNNVHGSIWAQNNQSRCQRVKTISISFQPVLWLASMS